MNSMTQRLKEAIASSKLSFQEIGKLHGKTESWARVTYHRAKMMIREELV